MAYFLHGTRGANKISRVRKRIPLILLGFLFSGCERHFTANRKWLILLVFFFGTRFALKPFADGDNQSRPTAT